MAIRKCGYILRLKHLSVDTYCAMGDTTGNLIEYWKRNAPRPKEQIPFGSVMNSLSTPFSAVEFKEDAVGRWSVRTD